ncbi:hypothetical protein PHYNN_193 [Pantoea phage Phynn]|nr:hypothetical protein PHYNN_193 [Pantoea phage Phynn]
MNMNTLTGKVIKLVDPAGFAAIANDGKPFTDDILAEFSELKVVRVYQPGDLDMSTGATGQAAVAFIACVPVSQLSIRKYDAERGSYDFEWNFFDDEMKFFEVVA